MRQKGNEPRGASTRPARVNTERPRVAREEDAEELVASTLSALDRLEPLIRTETELFRMGRVRDALAMAMDKNEAAQAYTICLEYLKSNAIALGRFRPSRLDELKSRHEAFSELMRMNMAVVATARTVSEGLMRDLADALGKNNSPTIYANGQIVRRPGTAPLSLSKAV
jgi:hypothetical protein